MATFEEVPYGEYITKFENVEPTADGKVVIEVVGLSGAATEGHLNALSIKQVPVIGSHSLLYSDKNETK